MSVNATSRNRSKRKSYRPPKPTPKPATPRPANKVDFSLGEPIMNLYRYKQLLEAYKVELSQLLPDKNLSDRHVRAAINAWVRTPRIQTCVATSILDALAVSFQLGLLANGIGGEGWLATFRPKWLSEKDEPEERTWCTFLAGYQGLLKLCYQHPSVASIKGACVYQGDTLEFNLGTNGFVRHHWNLGDTNRNSKPIIGAWAQGELVNAKDPIIVVMDKTSIVRCRDTQQDAYSLMWREHPDQGYRKSALRQVCKMLPKHHLLSIALELDNRFESEQNPSDLSPLNPTGTQNNGYASRSEQLMHNL